MEAVRTSIGPFLLSVAVAFVLAPAAFAQPAAQRAPATCSTYDGSSAPSSSFKGGDRIVIRGTGFGPGSLVLVSLQQGTRTVELARVGANDLGAFTLTGGVIPDTVTGGKAAIRAIDARGSATCPVTLTAGAAAEEGGMTGLYLVWGFLLAVFGAFLAVLTYRRWKTERLSEAVDRISWSDTDDGLARERSTRMAWEPDVDDREVDQQDQWLTPEPVEEPMVPQGPPPLTDADEELDEPSVLPVGWDQSRLRPRRQTSDAISRLRREVRTWKR